MYDGARRARAAYEQARALSKRLEGMTGERAAALKAEADRLAPPESAARRGFGGFGRGETERAPTLASAGAAAFTALIGMQAADVAPTERDVAACEAARGQLKEALGQFEKLRATAEGSDGKSAQGLHAEQA